MDLPANALYYLTALLILVNCALALFLLSWWFAGRFILWRNRQHIKAAPPGTRFRPKWFHHQMVAGMCCVTGGAVVMLIIISTTLNQTAARLFAESSTDNTAVLLDASLTWLHLLLLIVNIIGLCIAFLYRFPVEIEEIPPDPEDSD